MTRYEIPVVVNLETDPPSVLGRYEGTDEDTVLYDSPHRGVRGAPADCVKVETLVVIVR